MDGMQHEQFIKALNGLVELANTEYPGTTKINDAFRGFYRRYWTRSWNTWKSNIDVVNSGIEDSGKERQSAPGR